MTFSSVCWALGLSTPPWATTTVISSSYHVYLECAEQFLTQNSDQDAPHSLGGKLAKQFGWSVFSRAVNINRILKMLYRNYDHVSKLWQQEQWLPQSAVAEARTHYAAYSVQRTDGLRIITLNTDFCKRIF